MQKNIIESIDHILNHVLVCENTMAAKYMEEMERKIQAIKEDFNKEVLSIVGSKMEKTMSYVSHPSKIKRGRRWRNDIRVLLYREMLCLCKSIIILFKFNMFPTLVRVLILERPQYIVTCRCHWYLFGKC